MNDAAPGFSPLVVIPVYNHGEAIGATLAGVLAQGLPCLLVDDGSNADCARILDGLVATHAPQATLLRLAENQGKGGAVMAGLREALRRGYTHALQIDADGQHDTGDLGAFVAEARAHPDDVINGQPVYDATVPKGRLYGRYATHVWVWINTVSFEIRDAMCGFRMYPLAPTVRLMDDVAIGRRMDFDVEVIVRLYWRGLRVRNRPTRVIYPEDGVSHFNLWRDNVRISWMHARLFFGMLPRLPMLLWRKATRA